MSPVVRARRRLAHFLTFAKVAIDVAQVVLGFWLAAYVRFTTDLLGPAGPAADYLGILLLAIPIWIGIFAFTGMYEETRSGSEEVKRIFHGVNMGIVALILVSFLVAERDFSRGFTAAAWLSCLATVTAGRLLLRRVLRMLRRRGHLRAPLLVVGLNEEARALARTLRRCPWIGFDPVGFVAANGELDGKEIRSIDGLPVLGTAPDIADAVDASKASAVLVASSAVPEDRLARLYRDLQDRDVEIHVSAGLLSIAASRVAVEPLDGVPVLSLRRIQLGRPQAVLKRAFDLVLAAAALIVLSPVFLIVAITVKLTSEGPVFFRQTRVGRYGREFRIFKFRSMVKDAERILADLRAENEADGLLFKIKEDPRITRAGRFLRRWVLDELPQLFNVLAGSMSMVGPRPPLPEEVARYDDWLRGRVEVRPGMTGLWQVNGRHELTFDDYVRFDLFYVENWSMLLDVSILWRTLPTILTRKGSY